MPILAYSLAKGSEMGFVSIASSLSQQIMGGARAAGTFATQQGLSTSTAITTPRGDEVYVRENGYDGVKRSFEDGNGNMTTTFDKTTVGGGTVNSELNNAVFSGTNVGGRMQGASLKDAAINNLNSYSQQLNKAWTSQFNDTYGQMNDDSRSATINVMHDAIASKNHTLTEEFTKNLQETFQASETLQKAFKGNQEAYVQVGMTIAGSGAGVRASVAHEQLGQISQNKSEQAAIMDSIKRASTLTVAQNDAAASQFAKTLKGDDITHFQHIKDYSKTYSEAQNSIQAVQGNDLNNLINDGAKKMAAANGEIFDNLSTAKQNMYFSTVAGRINEAAQNDPASLQALQQEFGAGGTTQSEKVRVKATSIKYKEINASDFEVAVKSNKNNDQVNATANKQRKDTGLSDSTFEVDKQNLKDIKDVQVKEIKDRARTSAPIVSPI